MERIRGINYFSPCPKCSSEDRKLIKVKRRGDKGKQSLTYMWEKQWEIKRIYYISLTPDNGKKVKNKIGKYCPRLQAHISSSNTTELIQVPHTYTRNKKKNEK